MTKEDVKIFIAFLLIIILMGSRECMRPQGGTKSDDDKGKIQNKAESVNYSLSAYFFA